LLQTDLNITYTCYTVVWKKCYK